MLDKGSCLQRVHMAAKADRCSALVFNVLGVAGGAVITGRAALCCRVSSSRNKQLIACATPFLIAARKIVDFFRCCAVRKIVRTHRKMPLYATRIGNGQQIASIDLSMQ